MSSPSPTSHRHDRDAVDQREAVEGEPGGEPERPLLHREVLAERPQLVHRRLRLGGDVERLDQRVVAELREVGGHDQLAVDAEAAADAGEEEGGRPADRPVDRADGEERGELLAALHALAVAAEDRDAVDGEAAEQHAEVLDARVGGLLEQAAGDRDAGHVRRDREAGEVDRPVVGVEEVAVGDDVGDLQVVDRAGQPEHRDRAVHQHATRARRARSAIFVPKPTCSR